MATFWEIAIHSVDNNMIVMFVFWLYVFLVISLFGFKGRVCVLIASVPDLCILFTFRIYTNIHCHLYTRTSLSPRRQLFITDCSKAVIQVWFSVACFWCQSCSDVSPNVCSYYFSSVWVAEWPTFGKELLTRLTLCLCFDYLCFDFL